MPDKIFTSRSAVLSYKTCHYKRLLNYHIEGSGLVPSAANLDLLNGTCVHRGLQYLLEHCRVEHPNGDFEEACIDQAVEEARKIWIKVISEYGLALHSGEEDRLDWIIAEQETLWEGLIRAFAIRRLPYILEEYEILEVEHEEVSEEFSPPEKCYSCDGIGYISLKEENIKCQTCEGKGLIWKVIFLGKADGLFLRKADNQLVILSIKTTSEYADVTERDILHDMQGVSEWFLVQERLNKAYPKFREMLEYGMDFLGLILEDYSEENQKFLLKYKWMQNFENCPKVFAVQYEYLIKGQRKQDPQKSGIYKQLSFLCHPLKFDNSMPMVSFGFGQGNTAIINPDEYKWKWGAGKYKKGWEKCDIWNEIGIKNWINMLATGQVQPEEGHPFDFCLKTPDLVVRDEREIFEWLISTRHQEEEIAKHIKEIEEADIEEQAQILVWKYFDKNTQNCHDYYGKDCTFVRHCHEFASIEELKDAGYLIPRESHHEDERLYQIEKGYIQNDI